MPKMPDYVKVWARATGKAIEYRSFGHLGSHWITATEVSPNIPAADSAEWFRDCVEGLLVQDGLQTIDFTKSGSLIFVELYPWAKGTGPTPAAALLAAVLAMPPKEEEK